MSAFLLGVDEEDRKGRRDDDLEMGFFIFLTTLSEDESIFYDSLQYAYFFINVQSLTSLLFYNE
jgi:hypothetical protein